MRKGTLVLAFMALLLCFPSSGFAEGKKSDIQVGSTLVTEDNCRDVLGDGTVSYDFDTAVLTLNHADLTESIQSDVPHDRQCIFADNADLTILLIGENRIACTDPEELAGTYAVWIETHGTLTIRAESGGSLNLINCGICAQKLTLESGDIKAVNTSDIQYPWRFIYTNLYVTGGSFEGFAQLGGDAFGLMENTSVDFPVGTLFFEGEESPGTQVETLTDTEPREGEFYSMPYVCFVCPNAVTPSPTAAPPVTPEPSSALTSSAPTESMFPAGTPAPAITETFPQADGGQAPVLLLLTIALAVSILLNIILIALLVHKRKR